MSDVQFIPKLVELASAVGTLDQAEKVAAKELADVEHLVLSLIHI